MEFCVSPKEEKDLNKKERHFQKNEPIYIGLFPKLREFPNSFSKSQGTIYLNFSLIPNMLHPHLVLSLTPYHVFLQYPCCPGRCQTLCQVFSLSFRITVVWQAHWTGAQTQGTLYSFFPSF